MYLKPFNYLVPENITQVLEILNKYSGCSGILAGGTDLIVNMKTKTNIPQYIISLKKLEKELRYIHESEKEIEIGCLTTHSELDKNSLLRNRYSALAEGASVIGSPQIRHVGTIGGNICSALPSADTASPLIALAAKFVLASVDKERTVSSEDFFLWPGQSLLKNNELLKSIIIPLTVKNSGSAYVKFGRRKAMEIAISAVAVYVEYDIKNCKCNDIKIVLTSSGPKPWRCFEAERHLRGNKVTDKLILLTSKLAATEANPRNSFRSTEEYRRHLIVTLCKEALEKAFLRAGWVE